MPSNVVDSEKDEEKWEKAKKQAKKQGKGDDYEYIMGIYKKMDPDGIEKESSMKGIRKSAVWKRANTEAYTTPGMHAHNRLLNLRQGNEVSPEEPLGGFEEEHLEEILEHAHPDHRDMYEKSLKEMTGHGIRRAQDGIDKESSQLPRFGQLT